MPSNLLQNSIFLYISDRPENGINSVKLCTYVCMYACMHVMYGHYIQQSLNQPVKVANPARGQLESKNIFSPVPDYS